MNKLTICQGASILAGDLPIQSISGDSLEEIVYSNRYDSIYNKILTENKWDFNLKQGKLNLDEELNEFGDLKYVFILPSDFLRLDDFLENDDYKKPTDYDIIQNKLYCDSDSVAILYHSRVDEKFLPPMLIQAIEFELASQIALSLTEDKQKSQELSTRSRMIIEEYKRVEMLNRGAFKLFSSDYINKRKGYTGDF